MAPSIRAIINLYSFQSTSRTAQTPQKLITIDKITTIIKIKWTKYLLCLFEAAEIPPSSHSTAAV